MVFYCIYQITSQQLHPTGLLVSITPIIPNSQYNTLQFLFRFFIFIYEGLSKVFKESSFIKRIKIKSISLFTKHLLISTYSWQTRTARSCPDVHDHDKHERKYNLPITRSSRSAHSSKDKAIILISLFYGTFKYHTVAQRCQHSILLSCHPPYKAEMLRNLS